MEGWREDKERARGSLGRSLVFMGVGERLEGVLGRGLKRRSDEMEIKEQGERKCNRW